jgi:hypothetical protein
MKRIITTTLSLAAITGILIGCGGGGGSSPENTTTASSSSANNVVAAYNYNSDGSAVRTLNNEAVNTYAAVQTTLDGLKNDKAAFDTQLAKFTAEILQQLTPLDSIPSYAPRGNNKSMNVSVKNGTIDYSSYRLDGDANNDGSVDFKDIEILGDALYSSAASYDVNHDGVMDIKDVVYALARLNTEIASFDFYDTSYTKLPIAKRMFDDSRTLSYDGNVSEVIVVAKDSNGASGFEDTLSDSSDVWYKKSGWTYSDSELLYESNPASAPALRIAASVMVRDCVRAVTNMEVSPYLTGWHLSVSYVETGTFDGFGETGIDQFSMFLTEAKNKIDSHFIKSNMGVPGSVAQTLTEYVYHIGSTGGERNEVNADNLTYASSYTREGDTVTIKRIVHAASVLYESAANNTLGGKVNADVTLDGDITLDRIGPSPQEDTFKGSVTQNDVEVKNIPLGEYTATMNTACLCPLTLSNIIYDSPSAQANFSVSESAVKGTITIDVVDAENVPLSGKNVSIEADSCLDQGTGGSSLFFGETIATDDLGEAVFENMAFGDYKISVDGEYVRTIHVCENSRETIVLNSTWYLKYTTSSPYGSGSMIVKNFTYECEGYSIDTYGKTCSEVYIDDADTSITYSGAIAYDPYLTPLYIFENGLQLNYFYTLADIQGGTDLNILLGADYATGDGCVGVWRESYTQNLESGTAFNIAISGNGASCSLEFKPCTQELCE